MRRPRRAEGLGGTAMDLVGRGVSSLHFPGARVLAWVEPRDRPRTQELSRAPFDSDIFRLDRPPTTRPGDEIAPCR